MSTTELDRAIFAEIEVHWYKVARVVIRATARLVPHLTEDACGYDVVHRRLIELVAAGRLEAQGDLSLPRWSEVRAVAQQVGCTERRGVGEPRRSPQKDSSR